MTPPFNNLFDIYSKLSFAEIYVSTSIWAKEIGLLSSCFFIEFGKTPWMILNVWFEIFSKWKSVKFYICFFPIWWIPNLFLFQLSRLILLNHLQKLRELNMVNYIFPGDLLEDAARLNSQIHLMRRLFLVQRVRRVWRCLLVLTSAKHRDRN